MKTAKQGTPKRDGSGQGQKANQGRGGCKPANQRGGRGRNKQTWARYVENIIEDLLQNKKYLMSYTGVLLKRIVKILPGLS